MNYKDIIKSEYFSKTYSEVEEIKKDFPVNHGFRHIHNVLNNAKNIAKVFSLTNRERKLLYIACCLHDIGYLVNRETHAFIGGNLSKDYLTKNSDLSGEEIETIAHAISCHGGKNLDEYKEKLAYCLILADKMDFSKSRYSKDIKKYPKVIPFRKINKVVLVKENGKYYLDIMVRKDFSDEDSKVDYFNKLQAILDKLKEVHQIDIQIRLVY